MRTHDLGARLGQILLLALGSGSGCGGKTTTDLVTDADAALEDAASTPSSDDSGADGPYELPFPDASFEGSTIVDASSSSDASCTLVVKGYSGGANCKPSVFSCNPPIVGQPDCKSLCDHVESSCVAMDSGSTLYCYYGCGGRRPDGFEGSQRGSDVLRSVGAFFANLAELEAASVDAFEILRGELAAHDAPSELIEATEEAARDEVRHAKITAALARRFGGRPAKTSSIPRPANNARDLEAIATENACEGCVRETFGALVAMHQAERASDPAIRRAMKRIAIDETRHAALSWRLASWLSGKLDGDRAARARIDRAMNEALAGLAVEVAQEPAPSVVDVAGVPSRATAMRLFAGFRASFA